MPRKPRIEYEGAFYHVITRGNQRQRIFRDTADFQKYLLLLTVYKNRTGCHMYAYVLMNNHVHLLIETGEIPLSKIMQGFNQTYTMYYNRKYRTVGHLFQGRYKAILCDREAYLLRLLKYIHQNPIRAKAVKTVDEYAWSSHHAYVGKNKPLSLVDTDRVLRMFSESKARARRQYLEFMAERETIAKDHVYATVDQRLQGDETFIEQVKEKSDRQIENGKKRKEHSLSSIARAVEVQTDVSKLEMQSATRLRRVTDARRLVSLVARVYGYKKIEIAQYLKKDPAAVTLYLRERQEREKDEKAVIAILEQKGTITN
jgi:REP-associated tyrosine transposase